MSPEEKRQFRKANPQLPDVFFMSANDKKKYFEAVNNKFRKFIDKTPQRQAKTKKAAKFKN